MSSIIAKKEFRKPKPVDGLIRVLESLKGKKLLIAIKGYPDPDNISCALALKWMGEQFSVQSDILHFEKISHHENRALVKKLDIDIIEYSEDFDFSVYSATAINDSQSSDLPVELPQNCPLMIFVDHHKALGLSLIHI